MPFSSLGRVHSPCGKEHYQHNHFNLLTLAILETCKSTGCLEPKKRVHQKGTALDSATKSQWRNACQLILLRPRLCLHGELEDMSSAPVMQWDYWMAHSWNVEWCPVLTFSSLRTATQLKSRETESQPSAKREGGDGEGFSTIKKGTAWCEIQGI